MIQKITAFCKCDFQYPKKGIFIMFDALLTFVADAFVWLVMGGVALRVVEYRVKLFPYRYF